jgi:hypothetical protein
MAGIWTNLLLPALQTVWSFISSSLAPIFESLGESGFSLADMLQNVTTFLDNLADKLNTLQLPEWLTPGSPTPFEVGLQGIANTLLGPVSEGLASFAAIALEQMEMVRLKFEEYRLLLLDLYTVQYPTLQATWVNASQIIVTATIPVHDALRLLIALLSRASAAVAIMGEKFKEAMDKVVSEVEEAIDSIKELIDVVLEAAEAFRKMAEAAREAAAASDSAGSTAPGGELQKGTGLTPFRVPGSGGKPFPLTVHAGELVTVQPAGTARQRNRQGGDNIWNITINSGEQTGSVTQSLLTLMALTSSAA